LETALSEAESFINEVTEEVRRDKLFILFRRYGWIPVVLIVLIVSGTGYNEWRKAQDTKAAQALGDAIAVALENPEAADRAAALGAITANSAGTGQFLELLKAAELAAAGEKENALAILDDVAANSETPEIYRSLAELKAVILRGGDQERTERMAVLDQLAIPGSPFRVIAMEQKALALIEYGNKDEAIALLARILDEPDRTQALRQRTQQLIVALGGTLSDDRTQPDEDR